MAVTAFLSYSRLVDTHDNGRIMSLCDRLEREVEIQTGMQFTILRDQKDIKWGDRWGEFIRSGPQSASFLIPVISEPYFRSEQCATEYRQFAQHERKIGRTDLILPLYYTDLNEGERDPPVKQWKEDMLARQYFDWRPLRHEDPFSPTFGRAVTQLARQFARIMERDEALLPLSTLPEATAHTGNPVASDAPLLTAPLWLESLSNQFRMVNLLLFSSQVARKFGKLPRTQKEIMLFLYRTMQRDEISVDELFDLVRKVIAEDMVGTKSELFYRLRDLQNQGLIHLTSSGERTTSVSLIRAVQRAGNKAKIFLT